MANPRIAPYGTWISPISAEAVVTESLSGEIEDVILDPITAKVYVAEKRPKENGRSVLVDTLDSQDIFDGSWDARTKVHEYGGAGSTAFGDVIYFSNVPDNRVYKTRKGQKPTPITPINPVQRFTYLTVHPTHPDLIVGVAEDHTNTHPAKVLTYLVLINAATSSVTRFVESADFYTCVRFSPDGKFMVWEQWNFPEFPFQSANIFFAPIGVSPNGQKIHIGEAIYIAGKHEVVSAVDPIWTSNNSLFFVSDISGYHNPWVFTFDPSNPAETGKASPILPKPVEEEFGAAIQWWLSRHGCGALSPTKVAVNSFRYGRAVLYICDLTQGKLLEVETPYVNIQYMHGDRKGKVVMLGQPADAPEVVVELTLEADGKPQLKSLSSPPVENEKLPSSFISPAEYKVLTLPPDNRVCHVNYYPPKNPNYDGGLPNERPPVVALIHGGPFVMSFANLDWSKQFFTSRGWAYVDVNYGGSSGFGRAFRESLHGKWGILDVEDTYHTVLKLDALGLVDAKRAVVHGGSAGGYSVLQIGTNLGNAFAAGSPHYGVSDMRKLDEILHKFEYYLCDRLMGGTWEECQDVWIERSPIYHAEKIQMSMLVLQGEQDTIVPADQVITMVEKMKARGCKVELILFPQEGHGWRYASTIQTALERQLAFFNEILGLEIKA